VEDGAREVDQRTATALAMSFEGLLPHKGADSQKILSAFFSVDSRPILSTRGVGKRLLSIFQQHYNQPVLMGGTNEATKGILIRLNIVCPPGSYDVNVEPAKDDVLFADEEQLVDHFRRFLCSVYPRVEEVEEDSHVKPTGGLKTPPASSSTAGETDNPIQVSFP
jgi:DNA mismatch repair ATPase MutL